MDESLSDLLKGSLAYLIFFAFELYVIQSQEY